jgi:hypothetical protein
VKGSRRKICKKKNKEKEKEKDKDKWLNSQQKRLISPIFDGQKNNATDNLSLM